MNIKHLLNQTITIENPDGTITRQGKPNFDAVFTEQARCERTNKVISTRERDREPIDLVAFLQTTNTVKKGARLTYNDETYRIMSVSDVVGMNGSRHHYEIMAQLWSF